MNKLIDPHGGTLVDLMATSEQALELKANSRDWPSSDLTHRQTVDLEMLLNGGFSPLTGYMNREDYESVLTECQLTDGTLWPCPFTLDVDAELAESLSQGDRVALRDPEGVVLAALTVEDAWRADRAAEAEALFGTSNPNDPNAAFLLNHVGPWRVGGRVTGIERPVHYDAVDLRKTPAEVRAELTSRESSGTAAFQPTDVILNGELEFIKRTARDQDLDVLIQNMLVKAGADDVLHYARIRCLRAILASTSSSEFHVTLSPTSLATPGIRGAVTRAIIAKNFGCSHLFVPLDLDKSISAPAKLAETWEDAKRRSQELGITPMPIEPLPHSPSRGSFIPAAEANGEYGFTLFFTGLSGSGKSTIANIVLTKLMEMGGRRVTLLDGDLVRKHLSSELGFSREHRNVNIRRIGFVASEITKHGGVAVCAPIAPYDAIRKEVRGMVEAWGDFILVHVATPLEICESRDRKGLYAKARAGIIKEFTGVSDPYEEPADAELVIDAGTLSAVEAAEQVLDYLRNEGFVADGS